MESVASCVGLPSRADASWRRSVVCNEGERSEATIELRESKPGRALSLASGCACAGPDRTAQHTSATNTSHRGALVPRTSGNDVGRICISLQSGTWRQQRDVSHSPIMGTIRQKSVRERQTYSQNNSNCSQRSERVQDCSHRHSSGRSSRAITPSDQYHTGTVEGTGPARTSGDR